MVIIMIDLTIIIPHYNSVKSLNKLLSTIPSRDNIQVIVVDDKSNKYIDELEQLKAKYNNILFLHNNTSKKGAGVCRNIGMKYANGIWILFADADDFFLDQFYEIVSKYFQYNGDVVFFTPTSIDIESGNLSDRHENYKNLILNYIYKENKESEVQLRYQFFVPWSKLIRKKFICDNRILFDELIAANDVMFSTKVGYYMEDFLVSDEIIYCVTRGQRTLTTDTNIKYFDARLKAHIDYCNFLKSKVEINEQKYLNLTGVGSLINALKYYGIKKFISVYFELKMNNIAIFKIKHFNPMYLIKKINKHFTKYLNERKYVS